LSEDFFLNLGVQGGFFRKNLNWDRLVFADQINPSTGDVVFPPSEPQPSQTWVDGIDFASGFLFFGKRFYGGMAVHHLNSPEKGFDTSYKWPRKYTAHLGLHLPLKHSGFGHNQKEKMFVSPNVVYQQQGEQKRINYGLYVGFSQVVAGVWLRQDFRLPERLVFPETLVFLVGFEHENYKLGYSYDFSLSGYSGIFHGAHEVSVSFNLACLEKKKTRYILNCPIF